jgi:ParB family transcriptional regulator, chromosome partitioning protein
MAEKKRGLGRGFDALIPTQLVDEEFDVTAKVDESGKRTAGDAIREVVPELVDPNPHQPRQNFDANELQALAASIRVHGILQPLVVTKVGSRFELIAGERRLRAAKIAGLDTVPVIVRSFDEQEKLELALIENIQRAELNPLELATAYRKLVDQFNMSLADISQRVGRERSTVSNTMRLLHLPIEAKHALVDGRITEGHARVILSIEEADKQLMILDMMIRKHWTVRQAEEYARGFRGVLGSAKKAEARIAGINQLTMDLGDFLGTKVTQLQMAKGGKLVIEYYSEEELERIYRAIRHEAE